MVGPDKSRAVRRGASWPKGLVTILFVLSGAVFTLRGPFRALNNSGLNDLISPYVQVRIARIAVVNSNSLRCGQELPLQPDVYQFAIQSVQ